MQYGPDQVPVSNVSIIVGPPTLGPEPVPVTTTEVILEPPTFDPLLTPISGAGNVLPGPPPYAVAVAYANALATTKVFELNFDGSGVSIHNEGDGVITITVPGVPGGGYVAAGTGISVSTTNNISTVNNTGVLSISAGNGISVNTSTGAVTVTNSGILNITGTTGITASTINGNTTLTNDLTEIVYNGGSVSGVLTPNRNYGSIQKYTLTGNITLNVPANMASGQNLTLILTQDGVGGRLLTANSAYKFASSFNTLSAGAGAIDMLNIFYDGSTYYVTLTVGYE